MANISLYLDTRRARRDGSYPLKFSVTHHGKSALMPTTFTFRREHWDAVTCRVVGRTDRAALNTHLAQLLSRAQLELSRLYNDGELAYKSIVEVRDLLADALHPNDTPNYVIQQYDKHLATIMKEGTHATYKWTRDYIEANYHSLTFEQITPEWLRAFQSRALQTLSQNSVALHLNHIRAVVLRAVDEDVTRNNAFRKFSIKNEETRKRSLTIEQMSRLLNAETMKKTERVSIDYFAIIFTLIGINIVDLYNLRDDNVENGRVCYRRGKTGRLYSIKINDAAQRIINIYKGRDGYLLNLHEKYKDSRTANSTFQKYLAKISKRNGLPAISSYWARHTWATIAASLDIPKETISAALGHSLGSKTTAIYIDYDLKKVDKANEDVIAYTLAGTRYSE